jgi:DNA-binding response OmpR family regulator/predicted hydrocarbon binding protein
VPAASGGPVVKRDLAYVVHSDQVIAQRVSQALRDSDFEVSSMTTLEDAEHVIRERQFDLPDAILTPLRDMESGDSILIRLLESNPLMEQIPLVVIANAGAEERRRALRLGLLGVVAPPYDDEEVTLTTKLAIDKHRHDQALFGTMSQLSVADLLQTAEVGRRSGTVTFQHDNEKAQLWLQDGLVINAEIQNGLKGIEAVYEIATWETGTFEADFGSVSVESKFSMSPSELLLEAMRRLDERRAASKEGAEEVSRLQTLDTATAILNTVASYAANHMEVPLVLDRLDAIRAELAEETDLLGGFLLGSASEISVEPGWELGGSPEDFAGFVSTWIIRFFAKMEEALAWRFTRKRLAELFSSWRVTMESQGFVGFSEPRDRDNADASDGADVDSRPRQPVVRGSLPEGCLLLDAEMRVESYVPFGLRINHLDAETVVGRLFLGLITEEASAVAEVVLKSLARMPVEDRSSASTEFEISTGNHRGTWRFNLARRVVGGGFIVTLSRVRDLSESLAPVLERDPLTGSLRDAGKGRVVLANEDFLDAFETVFTKHMGFRHHEFLRELGRKWGLRHAFRLEQHVQREHGKTLREMETQMALELLSASVGVLGLGRFEADLSWRDAGIIVIRHLESPFPGHFVAVSGGACPILSGFHSAVLTYLSGRRLSAREFVCGGEHHGACIFIVATDERVSKLTIAVPGTPDHELVAEILASCAQSEGS